LRQPKLRIFTSSLHAGTVIWENNATALDEIGVSAYKPVRQFDPIAEMDGCAF
jgi:hypothetical protein